jgi:hypothetical protein
MSDARLDDVTRDIRSRATHGFAELTPAAGADPAITGKSLGGARLHFGFIDGISQPQIKWDDDAPNEADLIDFRHFILGYWSEDVQSFLAPGHGRIWCATEAMVRFNGFTRTLRRSNPFLPQMRASSPASFPLTMRASCSQRR